MNNDTLNNYFSARNSSFLEDASSTVSAQTTQAAVIDDGNQPRQEVLSESFSKTVQVRSSSLISVYLLTGLTLSVGWHNRAVVN